MRDASQPGMAVVPADAKAGGGRARSGAISTAIAAVSGVAPHVLHHIGLLAGVAILGGAAGTTLFGVIGFVASIPFLLRLRKHFGSWVAPGIACVVFAAMFSLSAFVIGPAIAGSGSSSGTPSTPANSHASHHHGG